MSAEEDKRRKSKKFFIVHGSIILVGLMFVALIGTNVLGFGMSKIGKNDTADKPRIPLPTIIDSTQPERAIDLPKEVPTVRNNHSIDCSYYETTRIPTTNSYFSLDYYSKYEPTSNTIPSTISCFIKNEHQERNNFFPVFVFDGVSQEISTNEPTDYLVTFDDKLKLQDEGRKRQYLSARSNAVKIIKYLIDTVSFGGEMALLDTVRFTDSLNSEGAEAFGSYVKQRVSTHLLDDESKTMSNNKREITVKMEVAEYTLKPKTPNPQVIVKELQLESLGVPKVFQKPVPVGSFYDRAGFEGITPDLYQVGQLFSHEYSHHVTQLNRNAVDKDKFLNKITELFPTGENQKRKDFIALYNYFNDIPSDSSLAPGATKKPSNADYRTLAIYRKYFSKNIVSLKEIFDDRWINTLEWRQKLLRTVNGFLEDSFHSSELIKELKDTFQVLPNGDKLFRQNDYNALERKIRDGDVPNMYFYRYDLSDFSGENGTQYTRFFPVSNTFSKITPNDENTVITVGDVFPTMKPIGTFPNTFSCTNAPYDPILGVERNWESVILRNILRGEATINNATIKTESPNADFEMLKLLRYHFSVDELATRMKSAVSFIYDDKRATLDTCGIHFFGTTLKEEGVKSSEGIVDYGFFNAFDFNILKDTDTTKTINYFLANENTISEYNKMNLKTNTYKVLNADGQTTTKTSKIFYSHNVVGSDIPNKYKLLSSFEEMKGSNTAYMLANLKLRDPSKINKIIIEFTDSASQKTYRRTNGYDFNHQLSSIPDNDQTYNANLNIDYIEEDKNNQVRLVFWIDTIQLTIDENGKKVQVFNNEYPTREALESAYSNITNVFIDENNNSIYDKGDITISLT